nr:immunoglobulin heavy chain junction region [Macaca mulatta]
CARGPGSTVMETSNGLDSW